MTVKELIELLGTMPPDALVATPHSWDVDLYQLDVIERDGVELQHGRPFREGSTSVFSPTEGGAGRAIVVIS